MAGFVEQEQSPLTALSDAVGGYTQAATSNRDKAVALALQKQKLDQDAQFQTRSLDLQQQRQATADRAEDFNEKLQSKEQEMKEELQPLMVQFYEGQIKAQDLAAKLQQFDVEFKQWAWQNGIPQKTAEQQLQQLTTDTAQKVANLAQTKAQTNSLNALLPGQIAQQKAQLGLTGAETAEAQHAANAPYPTSSGTVAAQKRSDAQADLNAEYSVMKARVDDAYNSGVPIQKIRSDLLSAPQGSMSNTTALRLLQYIGTLKPKAAPQQSGGSPFAPPPGSAAAGIGPAIRGALPQGSAIQSIFGGPTAGQ